MGWQERRWQVMIYWKSCGRRNLQVQQMRRKQHHLIFASYVDLDFIFLFYDYPYHPSAPYVDDVHRCHYSKASHRHTGGSRATTVVVCFACFLCLVSVSVCVMWVSCRNHVGFLTESCRNHGVAMSKSWCSHVGHV